MTRAKWQKLAERRLVDAKRLLNEHRWSAAYYLAGYAVECGLKSCILVRVAAAPEVIFETRRFSDNCWTHNLEELVKLAGLEPTLAADVAANSVLQLNWLTATDWTEQSRYQDIPHRQAKKLYAAIADKPNGVMQWIRVRW